MNKEIIYVRPYVAKFIRWHEKTDTAKIILSNYSSITAYTSILLATAQRALIDEPDLPPSFNAKVEVIIDIPALIVQGRFFITNYATQAIDTYCHRLFIEYAALQMDQSRGTRKEARLSFLKRLELSPDEIDEDTVRRLVDFTRDFDNPKPSRQMARVGNNPVVKHLQKALKPDAVSVLSLFPAVE